jgi:hypothetical protein
VPVPTFTAKKLAMRRNQDEEADWRNYKSIVPGLRERYLSACNEELIGLLACKSLTPTENFWNANERMDEIRGILRDCLDDHRRSRMLGNLMLMHRYQIITDHDLIGFSEEVRLRVSMVVEIQK